MIVRATRHLLSADEVLRGYDAVSGLYPHIPPMLLWRSWEYIGYQRYTLPEPVLDVGCGDGRFLRLVWPSLRDIVGVDIDPFVVKQARQSGVYRIVHEAPAHALPVAAESFASAFANCALEHMDRLDDVLASIRCSLRPGGAFLFSVVTDKFLQWAPLPQIVELSGAPERARSLEDDYHAYHHLVNPLAPDVWAERLDAAGFDVLEYMPIVPEMTSRLFLFLDHLWHVRRPGGEVGETLHAYLRTIPQFPGAFRQILAGVLQMESDPTLGSGAIFWAARR